MFWLSTRQELNRLRKAALAFGFRELLKGVGDLLERECTLLPDSAHPDAAFQLSHAAKQLKLASTGDSQYSAFDQNIAPMHTDFSSWAAAAVQMLKLTLKAKACSLVWAAKTRHTAPCASSVLPVLMEMANHMESRWLQTLSIATGYLSEWCARPCLCVACTYFLVFIALFHE